MRPPPSYVSPSAAIACATDGSSSASNRSTPVQLTSSHGTIPTRIGWPPESTMYGCSTNPLMPARTAAALDHASRPTGVDAPSATTYTACERISRYLQLVDLIPHGAGANFRFQRHDGAFKLLNLEVAGQCSVPNE